MVVWRLGRLIALTRMSAIARSLGGTPRLDYGVLNLGCGMVKRLANSSGSFVENTEVLPHWQKN